MPSAFLAMNAVQLFGRLHPLVLHFPIALLLLAAVVEGVRCFRTDAGLARLTVFLLTWGALSALAAAGTGWVFSRELHPEPTLRATLMWHRWLGVSTALLAMLAWFTAHCWADDHQLARRWIPRFIIWLTAVLVAIAAHLGARIVWGADYFS